MILVFDLDDTLYDELTYVKSGFKKVADFGENYFKVESNNSYKFMINYLNQNGRGHIFDAWLLKIGKFTKNNLRKCIQIYRSHEPIIKIFPESYKVLNMYYNKYPIYMVTDGNKLVQQKKIHALKVDVFFKKIFITHRFGINNCKPSLTCFKKIKQIELSNWQEIVYVGDNPKKDFVNLNKVGAFTVRVKTGSHSSIISDKDYEAKKIIDNLSFLPNILKRHYSL